MEDSLFATVLLPVALAVIMTSLGIRELHVHHRRRVRARLMYRRNGGAWAGAGP